MRARMTMTSLFAVSLLALAPLALAQQEAEPGVMTVTGTVAAIPNNTYLMIAPSDGGDVMRMDIAPNSQVEDNLTEHDRAKVWYREQDGNYVVVRAGLAGGEWVHDQFDQTVQPPSGSQQQAMQTEQQRTQRTTTQQQTQQQQTEQRTQEMQQREQQRTAGAQYGQQRGQTDRSSQQEDLPRTASSKPLYLAIGLLALAGAALVAVIRRF